MNISGSTKCFKMLPVKISIFLIWLAAVIDPTGHFFGVRYIALCAMLVSVVCMFCLSQINSFKFSLQWVFFLVLAGLLPLYGSFLYLLRTSGGDFIDTSYIAAGVLAFSTLLYSNRQMCDFGIWSLIISTRLMVFLIFLIFFASVFSFSDFIHFFQKNNIAFIGFREYSGVIFPYINLLASPLLILLLAYDFSFLKRKFNYTNLIFFSLTLIALFLTGTRAHMLISVLFILLYLLLSTNIIRSLILLFFTILFLPFIIEFSDYNNLLSSFFSVDEASNNFKISMLDVYIRIFSDPLIFIFGQGFNAHEWSSDLVSIISMDAGASKTELTYIELIRVFGVLIGSIFILVLFSILFATKRLISFYEWVYPGLFILLINAFVNPYLFSTNAILPLSLFVALISNRDLIINKYSKIIYYKN